MRVQGLGDDVDVLAAPRIQGGAGSRLGSLEQAILLAWAAQVGKVPLCLYRFA